MSQETRRFWKWFGRALVMFVIVVVLVSVICAVIAGVASIIRTGYWQGSWCLWGAKFALTLLFFVGMPASWAGFQADNEKLDERASEERSRVQRLTDQLGEWRRLQGVAPFQDAVDTWMHSCALDVRNKEAAAQAVANEVQDTADIEAARQYALRLDKALREASAARNRFINEQNRVRDLEFVAQELPVYLAMPVLLVMPDEAL